MFLSVVVGQGEARLALLLAAVDPGIGGVLLRGDKGSAKSTLAWGLAGDAAGRRTLRRATPGRHRGPGARHPRPQGRADRGDRVPPWLLSAAHGGVLYVDEVNSPDHLVDVLLDVAASGINRVERDGCRTRTRPASCWSGR